MRIIVLITILKFVMAQPMIHELVVMQTDTIHVDMKQSQFEWIGRKVTGEHSGTLKLKEGWVKMNGSTLIDGKLIIDMTSIENTDIESPEYRIKLEDHLKSSDFFNVDSFPQAILEIKKSNYIYEENDIDSTYLVSANLSIRGITNEISFSYQIEQSDTSLIAFGLIDIDRTLYNIKYKSGTYFFDLGDKIIYDEFTIKFKIYTLPL